MAVLIFRKIFFSSTVSNNAETGEGIEYCPQKSDGGLVAQDRQKIINFCVWI